MRTLCAHPSPQALAAIEGTDLTLPANNGNSPLDIARKHRGHGDNAATVVYLEALAAAGITTGGAAASAVEVAYDGAELC